jgi:hypothetical protein
MPSVCEQITAQMDEIAALVSDPVILRKRPELVIKNFQAAVKKVEMLQVHLAKKTSDGKGLDASVLTCGIQALVQLTMEKLMLPFKHALPSIVVGDFAKKMQVDHSLTDREDLASREIKETNCLAAVVLVYYYLMWHLACIKINRDVFSIFDDKLETQIESMCANLPTTIDLLESRNTKAYFKTGTTPDVQWPALKKANIQLDVMPYCAEPAHFTKTKMSQASLLFQQVLAEFKTSWAQTKANVTFGTNAQATGKALKERYVHNTAELFGGVFSTMQFQDETEMWAEMKAITEVIAPDDENQQVRYSSTLQKILSALPYSDNATAFLTKAYPLCVYHYAQLPLMIDVCHKMEGLLVFLRAASLDGMGILRMLGLDAATVKSTQTIAETLIAHELKKTTPKTKFSQFVRETPNNARMEPNHIEKTAMTVADIRGYYLFRGPVKSDKSNHVYVGCPYLAFNEQQTMHLKLQELLDKQRTSQTTWGEFVVPLVRNSFQVLLENKSIRQIVSLLKPMESVQPLRSYFIQYMDISAHDQTEYNAVLERHSKAGRGRYHKYAGVSWPVTWGEGSTNHDVFEDEGVIPRHYKGTMAEIVENLASMAHDSRSQANISRGFSQRRGTGFPAPVSREQSNTSSAGEGIVEEGGDKGGSGDS